MVVNSVCLFVVQQWNQSAPLRFTIQHIAPMFVLHVDSRIPGPGMQLASSNSSSCESLKIVPHVEACGVLAD